MQVCPHVSEQEAENIVRMTPLDRKSAGVLCQQCTGWFERIWDKANPKGHYASHEQLDAVERAFTQSVRDLMDKPGSPPTEERWKMP